MTQIHSSQRRPHFSSLQAVLHVKATKYLGIRCWMDIGSLPADALAHVLLQLSPCGKPLHPSLHSLSCASRRLHQAVHQAAPYWSAVGRSAWGSDAYIPGAPEFWGALRSAHQVQATAAHQ